MCQQATLELPHTGSSTATGRYQQATLSCPHTVAQAQQQAMYQRGPCLTRSLKHSNRLCTSTIELPHTVAQAMQQAMYQQATLSCPPHGRSSTATGYVPAGYLELPHRSSSISNRLHHSNLSCPHTVARYQQYYKKLYTLGCPRRSLKHSNGYWHQSITLSCLIGRLQQQAIKFSRRYLELPSHGRSSTATGYKIRHATLPHTVAQAQQAMYQQAILSLSTIVYSNRLCTSRPP
jgi:hypothetical protein